MTPTRRGLRRASTTPRPDSVSSTIPGNVASRPPSMSSTASNGSLTSLRMRTPLELRDRCHLWEGASALELALQPGVDDLQRELRADHPRSHGEHLGVVALAGAAGAVGVVDQG